MDDFNEYFEAEQFEEIIKNDIEEGNESKEEKEIIYNEKELKKFTNNFKN